MCTPDVQLEKRTSRARLALDGKQDVLRERTPVPLSEGSRHTTSMKQRREPPADCDAPKAEARFCRCGSGLIAPSPSCSSKTPSPEGGPVSCSPGRSRMSSDVSVLSERNSGGVAKERPNGLELLESDWGTASGAEFTDWSECDAREVDARTAKSTTAACSPCDEEKGVINDEGSACDTERG